MLRRRAERRRRGMTIVEAALVLAVFLMLLFGLFEYCRFLLVLHITENAARDGARYAVINGDKPTTFNTTDYTDAAGNVYPSITKYTTARMGGVDKQLQSFQIAVYPVDPTGLAQSPPIVRSKTNSTATPPVYPDPFVTDANTPVWNNAYFPDRIAVSIRGNYRPITPTLLLMPSSITLTITSMSAME